MASTGQLHRYTYRDYVALEAHSPVRHEFVAGEIYAMAGGTPEHAALAATLLRLIGNQLPSGCRAYTSDLRVRIVAADVTTYPDAAVIGGRVALAEDDPIAATNPIVIVEVTSPSTEDYDRGAKLQAYQQIESLREVAVVSHSDARIEVHRRQPTGIWVVEVGLAGQSVALTSLGARLEVSDVYDQSGDNA
jgi:Uma2 family endonuclease